jgi:hypothetical protein
VEDNHRDILEHVVAVIGTSEARLYEQVNSSFNWLLGTLFAANGGAVVALISRNTLVSTQSLALFAVGVVFSILMGLANAVYAAKVIIPLNDIRMTLTLMAAGEAPPEQLQQKMASLNEFTWIKWAMYGFGVLSLALLIGGMAAFACTV